MFTRHKIRDVRTEEFLYSMTVCDCGCIMNDGINLTCDDTFVCDLCGSESKRMDLIEVKDYKRSPELNVFNVDAEALAEDRRIARSQQDAYDNFAEWFSW